MAHLGSKTEEPKLDATLCFVRDKVGNSGGVENTAEDAAAASAEASEADAEATAVLREKWDSGEVSVGPCMFTLWSKLITHQLTTKLNTLYMVHEKP